MAEKSRLFPAQWRFKGTTVLFIARLEIENNRTAISTPLGNLKRNIETVKKSGLSGQARQ